MYFSNPVCVCVCVCPLTFQIMRVLHHNELHLFSLFPHLNLISIHYRVNMQWINEFHWKWLYAFSLSASRPLYWSLTWPLDFIEDDPCSPIPSSKNPNKNRCTHIHGFHLHYLCDSPEFHHPMTAVQDQTVEGQPSSVKVTYSTLSFPVKGTLFFLSLYSLFYSFIVKKEDLISLWEEKLNSRHY